MADEFDIVPATDRSFVAKDTHLDSFTPEQNGVDIDTIFASDKHGFLSYFDVPGSEPGTVLNQEQIQTFLADPHTRKGLGADNVDRLTTLLHNPNESIRESDNLLIKIAAAKFASFNVAKIPDYEEGAIQLVERPFEQSYYDETVVNGITISVGFDAGYEDYTIYFPQIDIGNDYGVADQVLRISEDVHEAKEIFDFACAEARREADVYKVYQKVEQYQRADDAERRVLERDPNNEIQGEARVIANRAELPGKMPELPAGTKLESEPNAEPTDTHPELAPMFGKGVSKQEFERILTFFQQQEASNAVHWSTYTQLEQLAEDSTDINLVDLRLTYYKDWSGDDFVRLLEALYQPIDPEEIVEKRELHRKDLESWPAESRLKRWFLELTYLKPEERTHRFEQILAAMRTNVSYGEQVISYLEEQTAEESGLTLSSSLRDFQRFLLRKSIQS